MNSRPVTIYSPEKVFQRSNLNTQYIAYRSSWNITLRREQQMATTCTLFAPQVILQESLQSANQERRPRLFRCTRKPWWWHLPGCKMQKFRLRSWQWYHSLRCGMFFLPSLLQTRWTLVLQGERSFDFYLNYLCRIPLATNMFEVRLPWFLYWWLAAELFTGYRWC